MSQWDTADIRVLYEKYPLDAAKRSIRLLHIHGADTYDDTLESNALQSHLEVVDLNTDNCLHFAALTYVWGEEPDGNQFINCSNTQFPISRNCGSALYHLRRKLGSFTIWIDAICINQHCEVEKLTQIPLMGDIYSRAATVYVWLGAGDESSNRAMKYLDKTGQVQYPLFLETRNMEDVGAMRRWMATLGKLLPLLTGPISFTRHPRPLEKKHPSWLSRRIAPGASYASYDDLASLLGREWIKRMWTFQEILLATHPIVVCGDYHLPWTNWGRSIIFLDASGLNCRADEIIIPDLEAWAEIVLARDRLSASAQQLPLSLSPATGEPSLDDQSSTKLVQYQKFVVNICLWREILLRVAVVLHFIPWIVIASGALWATFVLLLSSKHTKYGYDISMEDIDDAFKVIPNVTAAIKACHAGGVATCQSLAQEMAPMAKNITYLFDKMGQSDYGGPATNEIKVVVITLGIALVLAMISLAFILFIADNRSTRLWPTLRPGIMNIDLVTGLCSRKCTEPRDKALAMLSILQKLLKTDLPVHDKSQPLQETFREFTIRLIQATGSLESLAKAGLRKFDNFPSWVPNWAEDYPNVWLRPKLRYGLHQDATPGSKSDWNWEKHEADVLMVHGRRLIFISGTYHFHETSVHYEASQRKDFLHNVEAMLNFWSGCTSSPLNYYDYYGYINQFSQLAQLNYRQLRCWSLFFYKMRNEDASTVLKSLVEEDTRLFFAVPFSFRDFGRVSPTTWIATCREIFQVQVTICNCLATTNRAMFTTGELPYAPSIDRSIMDNRYILLRSFDGSGQGSNQESQNLPGYMNLYGFGSDEVCKGDDVVLVAGVSSPLIVRRSGNATRLISPAYIQAVMGGEFWNPQWKTDEMEEIFLS